MAISRGEGYRRGSGKEEGGLVLAEDFFARAVGVPLTRIRDPERNYADGDFDAPSGRTIECKRQPIDPRRYPQNFVEVFEYSEQPRHRSGAAALCSILGAGLDELSDTRVRVHGNGTSAVGRLPGASVSIRSIARAAYTVYANPDSAPQHLYVYEREELLGAIRAAVRHSGFRRGMGNSNEDTFAVLVPLPRDRWERSDADWRYAGTAEENRAITVMRSTLL